MPLPPFKVDALAFTSTYIRAFEDCHIPNKIGRLFKTQFKSVYDSAARIFRQVIWIIYLLTINVKSATYFCKDFDDEFEFFL